MRRLLVAAASLVPAAVVVAAIATAPQGKVVDLDNYNAEDTTSYINAAQCAGTAQLNLQWSTIVQSGGGDSYQLYASSAAPPTSGDTPNYCATTEIPGSGGTATVFAGPIAGGGAWTSNIQRGLASGADAVDVAGKTCTDNQVVYICAHLLDGTDPVGYASGKFTVQVTAPEEPEGVQAWPADLDALFVEWTPNTTGVTVDYYVVGATPVAGGAEVRSGPVRSGNEATLSGLSAGDHSVVVYAYSLGGNASGPSTPVIAAPGIVDDFWEAYRRLGGREEGGCGSGGTGPFALLALGLLALLRRRA